MRDVFGAIVFLVIAAGGLALLAIPVILFVIAFVAMVD